MYKLFTNNSNSHLHHFNLKLLKKKVLFQIISFVLFLICGQISYSQSTAQIENGSNQTSHAIPIRPYFSYTYSQAIYTASELNLNGINGAASITHLRFKPTTSQSSNKWKDWVIYMGNTSKSSFSTTSEWENAANMTKVFDGQIQGNVVAGQWLEITLSTPFTWDGNSNIVIAVDENTPGYESNIIEWEGYDAQSYRGLYFYDDNVNPNPLSPPVADVRTHILPKIQLSYQLLPSCSGTPSISSITPSFQTCPDIAFTLSAWGLSNPAAGLIGQWQSAPAGSQLWLDIPNAHSPTFTNQNGISSATDYRYTLKCTTTNQMATSTTVEVGVKSAIECYCTPGGNASNYFIKDFSTTGALKNISKLNSGYSLNGYGNFSSTDTVSQYQSLPIQFQTTFGTGQNAFGMKIWVDWNQDGEFDNSEIAYQTSQYQTSISDHFLISENAPIGSFKMRVGINKNSPFGPVSACQIVNGEFEDYTLNVKELPTCAGLPTAGNISGIIEICPDQPFTLTNSGHDVNQQGLSYQWQTSLDGNQWSNIPNENSSSLTVSEGISANSFYRFAVSCSNSGQIAYSNIHNIEVKPAANCYCSPQNITYGVIYFTELKTINGTSNFTSSVANNIGYGYFDHYNTHNVSQEIGKTFSLIEKRSAVFNYIKIQIWADWNQNGDFSDPGELIYNENASLSSSSTTIPITIPSHALIGDTRLRIALIYTPNIHQPNACTNIYFREVEDFKLTVLDPICWMPNEPKITNIQDHSAQLNWSLPSDLPDLGYEYAIHTDPNLPSNYTAIPSSLDSTVLLDGLSSNTTYYVWIRSKCSGSVSNSSWAPVTSFTTICERVNAPFSETFENGNLPSACWSISNSLTSNNENTFWKFSGTSEWLDGQIGKNPNTFAWVDASNPYQNIHEITLKTPLIDLSNLVHPEIRFDWLKNNPKANENPLSNNLLKMEINKDGVWTTVFSDTSNAGFWRTESISLDSSYSNSLIQIRFVVDKDAFGQGSYMDDILLDNLIIEEAQPQCNGNPIASLISASKTEVCAGENFHINSPNNTTGNLNFEWEESMNGGFSWSTISGAHSKDLIIYGGIHQNTSYRLKTTCVSSGLFSYSNIEAINIKPANLCYCQPDVVYKTEPITNVQFITINNSSSNSLDEPIHEDFTNLITSMEAGSSQNITLKGNTNGVFTCYFTVYIDLNDNGNLDDPGEMFYIGSIHNSTGLDNKSVSKSITIPANVTPGFKLLRVVKNWGNPQNSSCQSLDFGQIEDYKVEILPACQAPNLNTSNANPICSGDTAVLEASSSSGTPIWYESATSNDSLATGNIYSAVLDQNTTFYVAAKVGNCEGLRQPITVTVTEKPNILTTIGDQICKGYPAEISANASPLGATLQWYDSQQGATPLINNGMGSSFITDSLNAPQYFYVEAVNGNCISNERIPVPVTFLPSPQGNSIERTSLGNYTYSYSVTNPINVTSYEWEFRDGTISYDANPTHSYSTSQPYVNIYEAKVKLINDDNGCINQTLALEGDPLIVKHDLLKGQINSKGLARLSWNTFMEQNNIGFEIQKSEDGKTFHKIGFVASLAANGNSNTPLAYEFIDIRPVYGNVYYRFKEINQYQQNYFSNIVALSSSLEQQASIVAYPNPSSDKINIEIIGEMGNHPTIKLLDIMGKELATYEMDSNSIQIDLKTYAPGIYFINYIDHVNNSSIKINRK